MVWGRRALCRVMKGGEGWRSGGEGSSNASDMTQREVMPLNSPKLRWEEGPRLRPRSGPHLGRKKMGLPRALVQE